MTSETRLDVLLLGAAAICAAIGLAWWYIVFRPVLDGVYLKHADALTCIVATTDLCELAQALCLNQHFLGITRYSTSLLWTAAILLGSAPVPRALRVWRRN